MSQTMNEDLNVIANSDLEITYLDGDLAVIQKLDDEPNDVGGLTSAQLKAKFDQAGLSIQKYINETLIPELLAADATEAARAAAEAARETAEAARASAEAARAAAEQAREDATSGIVAQAAQKAQEAAASAEQAAQVVMGKIPDGSITKEKLVEDVQNILNRAENCATLGADGKIPSGQLPSMDYVPTDEKGQADGVATLGADGVLTEAQRPRFSGILSDDGSKTLAQQLSESAGLQMELLWENASPTSAFAAQTVNVTGIENYGIYLLIANGFYDLDFFVSYYIYYGKNNLMDYVGYDSGSVLAIERRVEITEQGFVFADSKENGKSTGGKHIIPYRIYGITI